MRTRTALVGGGSLALGIMVLCLASVWWAVNGITAIDTPDGEPSGPLHGYGVTAVLVLAGSILLLLGIRRLVRAMSGPA